MKKEQFLTSFLAIAQTSASERATKAQSAFTQYEQTKDDDVKRLAQKNATHAKYNGKLAELSKEALSVAYTHKLDASAIVEQSRELKKRLMGALEAIAHNDKSKLDKALLSLVAEIVATDRKEWTINQVQQAMGHSTATQARYFKNWAEFLKIGSFDKSTKITTIDTESALFKKLVALFD